MSDTRGIVRQLAAFVATALGDGWTVDTGEAFREHVGSYVDGPGGARLFLRTDWRNDDRLEVSGIYPDGARDVYPDPEHFRIGMARDKDPAAIARDITRRLLPKYLPELARVTAGIDRNGRNASARDAFARELAEILPGYRGAPADCSAYPGKPAGYVRAWVAGGYVDLQVNHNGTGARVDRMSDLPADLWRELARVMRDYTARTGGES